MSINTTFSSIFQDSGRPPISTAAPVRRAICVIMPNVVPIGQTVAEISQYLDFPDGIRRHLNFLTFLFVTVRSVKRVELRHRAKFR